MGQLKQMYDDYLSSEDFDLMFNDEYELWLEAKTQEQKVEQEEYYQAIGDGMNQNYCM
jgi:hypothetical protein